jgi:putative peptidoglycan lipid II flippase
VAMGAVLWLGQGLVMPYVQGTWTVRIAAMAALVTSGVVVYGLAAVLTGAFRVDDLKLLLRRRRSN